MTAVPWPIAPSPMMPSVAPYRSPMSWVKKQNCSDLLPDARFDVLPVREQIAAQRQYHREGMFRHGVYRIVADIGDRDSVLLAVPDVDHVVAGGRHGDHLQLRQLLERLRPHRHLVDDRDARTGETRHDVLGRGLVVLHIFGGAGGTAHRRLERGAIQKHDPPGHAAMPAFATFFAKPTGEWLRQ